MLSDILRPFNLLSLILAMAGMAWGVYSYYASKQTASISFVEAEKSIFEDTAGEFSITRKSGEVLPTNKLSVVRFVFWNSGTLPINTADLRRPLQILVSSNAKIIDAKVVRSYPEHAQFTVANDEGNLQVGWKYFDPQFAFVLDVFQTGSEDDVLANLSYISDANILHKVPIRPPPVVFACVLLAPPIIAFALAWIARRFSRPFFERTFPKNGARIADYSTIGWCTIFLLIAGWRLPDVYRLSRAATGFAIADVAQNSISEVAPLFRLER